MCKVIVLIRSHIFLDNCQFTHNSIVQDRRMCCSTDTVTYLKVHSENLCGKSVENNLIMTILYWFDSKVLNNKKSWSTVARSCLIWETFPSYGICSYLRIFGVVGFFCLFVCLCFFFVSLFFWLFVLDFFPCIVAYGKVNYNEWS